MPFIAISLKCLSLFCPTMGGRKENMCMHMCIHTKFLAAVWYSVFVCGDTFSNSESASLKGVWKEKKSGKGSPQWKNV